jgi:hypothetical protein
MDANNTATQNPQVQALERRVVTHKVCSSCHRTKPIEDFYSNKASADGHQAACIPCLKDYQKSYRARRRDPKPSPRKAVAQPAPAPVANPTRELVSDPEYAQSIARTAQLRVGKGVAVKVAFELAIDLAESGLIVRAV